MITSMLLPGAAGDEEVPVFFLIVVLALIVVVIAGMWKTNEKAGEPGWACIVPIYNVIVMLRIA